MKGYCGKILKVDLNINSSEIIALSDSVYEKYLSGAGLGAWYIYNNIPKGCDRVGKCVEVYLQGILTGTGSVMTGRFTVRQIAFNGRYRRGGGEYLARYPTIRI